MSSTSSLLRLAVLAVLVVVGLPQVAHADFIDLVSQSYHIDAVAFGCCPAVPPVNETSATPISFDKDGMFFNGMGQPIGGFSVFASASGGVTPLSAFAQAQTNAFDVLQAGPTNADASARITFRPLVTNLVVRPTDPWFPSGPGCPCFGLAGLNDETTGSAVLTFPPYAFPFTPAYSVSLNLDHIYTIYASSGGSTEHGVRLSIAPASVPESESTLTFFVVGLGALLVVARSQKFRSSN